MNLFRMIRALFAGDEPLDPAKPTDQEVSDRMRASREASLTRQAARARRTGQPPRQYNAVERRYLGGRQP